MNCTCTKDLATLAVALALMVLVSWCARASGEPHRQHNTLVGHADTAAAREMIDHMHERVPLPQRRKPPWFDLFFPKDDVAARDKPASFEGVVP